MRALANREVWVPVAVFVLIGGLALASWWVERGHDRRALDRHTDAAVDQLSARLAHAMELRLALLRRVAAEIAADPSSRARFDALGPALRRDLPALTALYRIDDRGVVRQVTPPGGANLRAVGQDLTQPGGGSDTFRAVARGGAPRMSQPVHLLQGGRGVLAVVPVGRRAGEEGFLGAVFALPELVTGELDGATREGYRLRVMDGPEVVAVTRGGATSTPWARRRSVAACGRTWRVTLAPTRSLRAALARSHPDVALLFGVVVAAAMALLQRRLYRREGRVRRREERYRSMFANAQVGIFRVELETGRVLEANALMARMFGYDSPEQFAAEYRMADNWVDPDERERMHEAFEHGGGVISNFESRFRARSGEPLWVRFSARLFPREGYMEGVGQSIAVEKQTTRALVESEQRFRGLAESVSAMILIAADDGQLVYANPEATRCLGYDNDELLQMGVDRILAPDSVETFERLFRGPGGGESRPPARMELQFVNAAGSERWFEVSGARVELGQGVGQGRLATCFDITDRRRAGAALRESEARYRTIFETTGTATVILDEDARIILANAGFANLTGYSLNELEGTMSWGDFFHDEGDGEAMVDAPQRMQTWDSVVPESYEVQLVDRYGRRHDGIVTVNLIPGTIQRVASFLDLTDRKQAERQMFRAEKMAALGQIIAGVAHEINNPNNFIYFNLPILRRYIDAMRQVLDRVAEQEPDLRVVKMPYAEFMEDVYKLVDNMQHGSSRITEIVGELKQHVRDEDEQKRPEELGTVVDRAVTLVGKQVRKMVGELRLDVQRPLPAVMMNAGKIEQVLINLLINAAQAADKDDSWVELRARRGADRLILTVEDNGCGIPVHLQEQIFDPFFTTKGRDAGTGLGLSISQRIVEEHGGRLTVASTVGQGSCFTVSLPSYTTDSGPEV